MGWSLPSLSDVLDPAGVFHNGGLGSVLENNGVRVHGTTLGQFLGIGNPNTQIYASLKDIKNTGKQFNRDAINTGDAINRSDVGKQVSTSWRDVGRGDVGKGYEQLASSAYNVYKNPVQAAETGNWKKYFEQLFGSSVSKYFGNSQATEYIGSSGSLQSILRDKHVSQDTLGISKNYAGYSSGVSSLENSGTLSNSDRNDAYQLWVKGAAAAGAIYGAEAYYGGTAASGSTAVGTTASEVEPAADTVILDAEPAAQVATTTSEVASTADTVTVDDYLATTTSGTVSSSGTALAGDTVPAAAVAANAPGAAAASAWTTIGAATAAGLAASLPRTIQDIVNPPKGQVPSLNPNSRSPASGPGSTVNVGSSPSGSGIPLSSLFGQQPGSLLNALGGGQSVALAAACGIGFYLIIRHRRAA